MLNTRVQELITQTREQLAKNAQSALFDTDSAKNVAPTIAIEPPRDSLEGSNTLEKTASQQTKRYSGDIGAVYALAEKVPDILANPDAFIDDPRFLEILETARRTVTNSQTKEEQERKALALETSHLRWGKKAGAGEFVAFMLACAKYARPKDSTEKWFYIFCPDAVVCELLEVSEDTLSRWCADPAVRRWLSSSVWWDEFEPAEGKELPSGYTTEKRNGGTIWKVRYEPLQATLKGNTPNTVGLPAPHIMRLRFRNLGADMRDGRTVRGIKRALEARETMQQADQPNPETPTHEPTGETRSGYIKNRLKTALCGIVKFLTPLLLIHLTQVRSSVLSISASCQRRNERGQWVDRVARNLAADMRDLRSVDKYKKIAWTILKAQLYGNAKPKQILLEALRQVSGMGKILDKRRAEKAQKDPSYSPRGMFLMHILNAAGWSGVERAWKAVKAL